MTLENYIEKVTDEIEELEKQQQNNEGDDKMNNLDDFMNEFGLETGEKSTDVLSVLRSKGAEIPEHYIEIRLNECYNDDIKEGKPYIGPIIEKEFEDKETGVKTVKLESDLVLVDNEHSEVIIIPMSINQDNIIDKDNEVIKDIHVKSQLFRLINGVAYLKTGKNDNFSGYDTIGRVNLGLIRDYVESLPNMTVTIKEVSSNDFSYNSFVVENMDDY